MTKTINIPMLSAFDKFWHDCLDKQPTDIYTSQIDTGTYNASKIAMLPIFKAGYESAQSILSQGEPENKVIDTIDYDEKLKSFYINGNQPSTEALQKKEVSVMTKTIQELKLLAKEKAFDVHVYEGEFSHHETEYTFTESSIFELLQAQVPLQGELVAWRQTVHVEVKGIKSVKYLYNDEKIMVDDEPLYLAPPSTEALQKDKAEMIEYAENIVVALDAIMLFGTDIKIAKEFAKVALETKKPKCMEGMMN